jgi:hypothetical protein
MAKMNQGYFYLLGEAADEVELQGDGADCGGADEEQEASCVLHCVHGVK